MQAIHWAKKHNVPVVLTLGTKYVIADNPQFWRDFLREHVSVVAMNEDEAYELTGERDPLQAANIALDWVDLVLCTAGPNGLYMAAFTEGPGSAPRSIHCCREPSRSSTSTNSVAPCVTRIVLSRCVFFSYCALHGRA